MIFSKFPCSSGTLLPGFLPDLHEDASKHVLAPEGPENEGYMIKYSPLPGGVLKGKGRRNFREERTIFFLLCIKF